MANVDEDVEVYVSHGRETSIRVFESEIEELTTAESAGVGVDRRGSAREGRGPLCSARTSSSAAPGATSDAGARADPTADRCARRRTPQALTRGASP